MSNNHLDLNSIMVTNLQGSHVAVNDVVVNNTLDCNAATLIQIPGHAMLGDYGTDAHITVQELVELVQLMASQLDALQQKVFELER